MRAGPENPLTREGTIDETATVSAQAPPSVTQSAGGGTPDDDGTPDDGGTQGTLSWRAARTRQLILDASRKLFLDRGYAGTRINNITDACKISRAGFYTYFQDKRAVFNTLGESAYRDMVTVIRRWDEMPRPCSPADVEQWVQRYFELMDDHGAFILSAQSGPGDEEVRVASTRLQMRVCFLLGASLRSRQRTPVEAPEALGLAIQAMLDRSWYQCRAQHLPVDAKDVIGTVARTISCVLAA
jgi:AcrR family transcriptional regulator